MRKAKLLVGATLIAGLISGCIIRSHRPCRTDCWWDHGRKVCERRCN
jgi:hypothetical protein